MGKPWILRPHQLKSRSARGKLERSELKVLAKGDSWFSSGSFPVCNMLQQMRFSRSACILNLAIPGDTAAAMSERIQNWQDQFSFQVGVQDAPRWDAILISAGGNDMINALPHLIRGGINFHHARDYVDSEALFALEQGLVASYARIVSFRDREGSPNRGVPIFAHTYDYTAPSCAPARFYDLVTIAGPWLSPQMRDIPGHLWSPLSNYLLDCMANTLRLLEVTLPNVVVIDTRGTLCSVRSETTRRCGDWQNEIHPSRAGYRKLAPVVASAVDRHLRRSAVRPYGASVSWPLSEDESRFGLDCGNVAGFLRQLRMQP
jgi:lysophospholipase L1-like esterase